MTREDQKDIKVRTPTGTQVNERTSLDTESLQRWTGYNGHKLLTVLLKLNTQC